MFNRLLSFIGNKAQYHKLYQQQQDSKLPMIETFGGSDARGICLEQKRSSRTQKLKDKTFRALILLNIVLLVANGVHFVKLCKGTAHDFRQSPTFEDFPSAMVTSSIDIAYFTSADSKHIYRRPPSPEVDRAWDYIAQPIAVLIEREDVDVADLDVRSAVKAPPEFNATGEKYIAHLDTQHQLHCLNHLRMALFADYYHSAEDLMHPEYMPHLMHCLDLVRQNIMCHADTNFMPLAWAEDNKHAHMPRRLNYQCRDYEAFRNWAAWKDLTNIVGEEWDQYLHKPVDAVQLPAQPRVYDLVPAESKRSVHYQ